MILAVPLGGLATVPVSATDVDIGTGGVLLDARNILLGLASGRVTVKLAALLQAGADSSVQAALALIRADGSRQVLEATWLVHASVAALVKMPPPDRWVPVPVQGDALGLRLIGRSVGPNPGSIVAATATLNIIVPSDR